MPQRPPRPPQKCLPPPPPCRQPSSYRPTVLRAGRLRRPHPPPRRPPPVNATGGGIPATRASKRRGHVGFSVHGGAPFRRRRRAVASELASHGDSIEHGTICGHFARPLYWCLLTSSTLFPLTRHFPPFVVVFILPPSGPVVLLCPLMPSRLVFTCFLWLSLSNHLSCVSAGCRDVEAWAMSASGVSAKSRQMYVVRRGEWPQNHSEVGGHTGGREDRTGTLLPVCARVGIEQKREHQSWLREPTCSVTTLSPGSPL